MKKNFFLLSLMLAVVFTASAATKTIGGAGADYASLYAASVDLYANPITENTEWIISADLTETLNAGIVNNTEYTLTIRPDAANRVISYTTASDNYGPSGNFVIGGIPVSGLTEQTGNSSNIKWAAAPSKNIIIDGSHDGTDSRDLTITSNAGGGRAVVLYGDVRNVTIKNTNIINTRSTGTNYALELRVEQLAGSSGMSDPANKTNNTPSGTVIENCYLQATVTNNSQTIVINSANRLADAGRVQNTIIKNCEIFSKLRGIFIDGANNLDVLGCTFRVISAENKWLGHGIMGNGQTGIVNVMSCKFLELTTNNVTENDYGIQGITASGGGTWNIENNIFTGLDALNTGVTSKSIKLCAVRCGSPCVVRHNTFVMPTLTNAPATPLLSAYPVSLLYVAGTTYTVENNIFISHETVANNSLIRGALNEDCAHNVFYHDGGNAAIIAGAAVVTDEAGLATADPTSKWNAVTFDSNMMLDGASTTDINLAVMKIEGIDTDITGATRQNPTYAGAEDPGTLPVTYHLYELGTNNGFSTTASDEMEAIAPNVFEGVYTFSDATSYFTFATVQDESWDVVNAHRWGAPSSDYAISNGQTIALHWQWANSFAIPAGKYKLTVDLSDSNDPKVTVKQLWDNIYMFSNITGDWVLGDGVALTKTAENVFELDECEIPEGKYIIFSSTHGAGWDNVNAGRLYPESDGNFWVDGDGYASISATPADDKTLLIKAAGKYAFTIDLNEGKIFYTQLTAKVSFDSEIGYATYYNSRKGYTMPTDVTGYAFNYPGAGLTQAFEADEDVPAGVALVLAGPAGTFDLVLKEGVPAVDLANQLRGTDADELTTAPGEGVYLFYGLSLAQPEPGPLPDPETVGFYWMVPNGAAFTNKAHKAYLALPENILAPSRILFQENDATGIENVEGQEKAVKFIENGQIFIRKDGVVYDAMGRVIR